MNIMALHFVQTGTLFVSIIVFLTLELGCFGFHMPLVRKPIGMAKLLSTRSDWDFFRLAEIPTMNPANELFSSKLRKDGRELLSSLPLPHEKDEAWRFTNIRKLFSTRPFKNVDQQRTIDVSTLSSKMDLSIPSILFVDGEYCGILNEQNRRGDYLISNVANALSSSIDDDVSKELSFAPQKGCQPRESFGSELLSALNMVRFNTSF